MLSLKKGKKLTTIRGTRKAAGEYVLSPDDVLYSFSKATSVDFEKLSSLKTFRKDRSHIVQSTMNTLLIVRYNASL